MGLVLLDSHALLWSVTDADLLSEPARALIVDGETTVAASAASAWELAIKHHRGRLPSAEPLVREYFSVLARHRFVHLDISPLHALRAAELDHPHHDPFDRMLVAQAQLEDAVLISADEAVRGFPDTRTLW